MIRIDLNRFLTANPNRTRYASRVSHLDIAVRVTDHPMPDDAVVTHLFAERCGPVLSPELADRLNLRSAADLADAPRLGTRTRPGGWATWCASAGIPALEAGTSYEHFYFMLEAAAAGLGVAIAPEPHVADDLAAGRLVAPFGLVPSGLDYVAARRKDAQHTVRRFCEWLGQEAKAGAHGLHPAPVTQEPAGNAPTRKGTAP